MNQDAAPKKPQRYGNGGISQREDRQPTKGFSALYVGSRRHHIYTITERSTFSHAESVTVYRYYPMGMFDRLRVTASDEALLC